jgi:hypothetical protein
MKKCLLALMALMLFAAPASASTITMDFYTDLDPANDPAWGPSQVYGGVRVVHYGPNSIGGSQDGLDWTLTGIDDGVEKSLATVQNTNSYYGEERNTFGLGVYNSANPEFPLFTEGQMEDRFIQLDFTDSTGGPIYLQSLTFGNVGYIDYYAYNLLFGDGTSSGWITGHNTESTYGYAGYITVDFDDLVISGVQVSGHRSVLQGFSVESESETAATPEPATMVLLVSALGVMALFFRRRKLGM